MLKNLQIPKYHANVILIYLLILPFLIIFFRDTFVYNFSSENTAILILITVFSLVIFFTFLPRKKYNVTNLSLRNTLFLAFYSIAFAFPEEIIFRGIVQGFLVQNFSPLITIISSSLIFGIAHLLNGAKGYSPRNLNWTLAALVSLAGIPLGIIFYITNSLLVPTILHALFIFLAKVFSKEN